MVWNDTSRLVRTKRRTASFLTAYTQVNVLSHYVIVLRLLDVLKKTAQSAPPATVRIVMQSSEMHRFAPSDRFTSKEEINQEADGVRL